MTDELLKRQVLARLDATAMEACRRFDHYLENVQPSNRDVDELVELAEELRIHLVRALPWHALDRDPELLDPILDALDLVDSYGPPCTATGDDLILEIATRIRNLTPLDPRDPKP